MKKIFFSILFSTFALIPFAQNLGINPDGSNPDPSAMLDVKSVNKGMLIPRMNILQRNAIVSPATGLMVYQTDIAPGFYYYNGAAWIPMSGYTNNLWSITGNTGINSANNFIGTTDDQPLIFKVNNIQAGNISTSSNTYIGYDAGTSCVIPQANTGFGYGSLHSITDGNHNVAVGVNSLYSSLHGTDDIAIGSEALYKNTDGILNIAIGRSSMLNNETGSQNIAIGDETLLSNISGGGNIAIGHRVLKYSTAELNTAVGHNALALNTTGGGNTALGYFSLLNNVSGYLNTAVGINSMQSNKTGTYNTAVGNSALNLNEDNYGNTAFGSLSLTNTKGNLNTGIGSEALRNNQSGYENTSIGDRTLNANVTGNYNTAIGALANVGAPGLNNATAIGSNAQVGCDNCVVLGSAGGVNGAGSDARVGIGTTTPDASAALEINSSSRGLLIPRMTQEQRDAIATLSNGLLIYQTDNTPGFYFYNSSAWTSVGGNTNNLWSIGGNTGIDPATNFIGTTDIQPLIFKFNNEEAGRLNNTNNTAFGRSALLNNTTSGANTAFGINSLRVNTTGSQNTAVGAATLNQNTTGGSNTAIGTGSLNQNTTGVGNTAIGSGSIGNNSTGIFNTATGANAMLFNTTGNQNTSYGTGALNFNASGSDNTAIGNAALHFNTIGGENTAVGSGADVAASDLNNATAIGAKARVDCNNCMVLGSVNGVNTATSDVKVGIGTTNPNASAVLDLSSTNKGLLIPRMTLVQRDAVSTPSTGLMIYQTDGTSGFYYYNGSAWTPVAGNTNNLWSTNGNTGTNPATNFIGTSDNQPLVFKINNQIAGKLGNLSNISLGVGALINVTGNFNIALGVNSLRQNTSGNENTAIGVNSLSQNISGIQNTAIGSSALINNTNGNGNVAIGSGSLLSNTTGFGNTSNGINSLFSNSTGSENTSFGEGAMTTNTTGSQNTAIGGGANVSADGLNNATVLGYGAVVNASNKVRIGNGAVTVIEGQVPFTTPSDGRYKYNIKDDVKGLDFVLKLRPVTYQFDAKRLDAEMNASGVFNTSYQQDGAYKAASDIRRTGFIAQEVEKAAFETGYDFSGIITPKTSKDHYSLSYESFVVPLVKAVQEQQNQIEELKKENEELKKLKEQVEKLTKAIQEISANK